MSLQFLQQFSLTQNEADLYEILLRLGEVPVVLLIRESGLKKPTVYKSLYSLEKKGLIAKSDIRKKLHFRPEAPTKLLQLAENQYEKLDRAKTNLQSAMTQLSTLYISSTEKPVVRVYEGVEGIKTIYKDTLAEGKPIYAIEQIEDFNEELWEWATKYYLKERPRRKIHAKVIVVEGKRAAEYRKKDIEQYRTSVIVSPEKFPFENEVDIYGDKVAFMNYRKNEPLLGVVVKHPKIAATMKAWFDLAWDGAIANKSKLPGVALK